MSRRSLRRTHARAALSWPPSSTDGHDPRPIRPTFRRGHHGVGLVVTDDFMAGGPRCQLAFARLLPISVVFGGVNPRLQRNLHRYRRTI